MKDPFGRTINYLRVSVTDRCNLRCRYCMPQEGITLLDHKDILTFEQISEVVGAAVGMGVSKVRLTGGEPLVRLGVVDLVTMLARIRGIHDLAMTTNGVLLPPVARDLRSAGLMRVNVSLDAMDPQRYAEITRGGDVAQAVAGVDAAEAAGLTPIKLNCVVGQSPDEPDARAVAEFGRRRGFEVRFIHRMDLAAGSFSIVEGGSGGDCRLCSRLRLTSNGYIRPCLFSDLRFNVRQLGAREAIARAVAEKPPVGTQCTGGFMRGIGG